jgi:MoaA/NifB/PqqE/SkfB family radical SAM enzyme
MLVQRAYRTCVRLREALRCNAVGNLPALLPVLGTSPISANIRLTNRCSARCRSCRHWHLPDSNELRTERWRGILAKLFDIGVLSVTFTGGDILLRDDVFELMHFCASAERQVGITLNGYSITPDVARNLMAARPSFINLSLDSLDEQFDHVRGVQGSAALVRSAIQSLRSHDNGVTRIGIAATLMKDTLDQARKVTQFAIQNRLAIHYNLIHFTHYFSNTPFSRRQYQLDSECRKKLRNFLDWLTAARGTGRRYLPSRRQIQWIRSYFDDFHQRNTPCLKTMLKICIEPNGDVKPCCSMESVGNLQHQEIRQILRSPACRAVVRKGLSKNCPGCSCHYILSLDANFLRRLTRWFLPDGRTRKKKLLEPSVSFGPVDEAN